ncbi:unannotated protein [freshwater metagenome]|uniref:Unannotated protein n=1 Tax=freshwater metagenome TaxID=449393 RepID=A0A6J7QMP9_9ZZZZ
MVQGSWKVLERKRIGVLGCERDVRPLAVFVLEVLLSGLSPRFELGALVEGAAPDAVAWRA